MNILTFDLEDWFHILGQAENNSLSSWSNYESNLSESVEYILTLLEKHRQRASFFCLGWIADKYPHLVREIQRNGHEIGSHTYAHRRISEYSKKQFHDDVERSIKSIEDITGCKVTSFRFPGFQINTDYLWALEVLVDLGIETDSSVQVSYRNTRSSKKSYPAKIITNKKTIREFPVPVLAILQNVLYRPGSGYFRLFPYVFTRNYLKANIYNMVYFHPRDILEPPKNQGGFHPVRRFKSKKGIKNAAARLELLLSEFSFTDIRTAANKVNWQDTRTFNY